MPCFCTLDHQHGGIHDGFHETNATVRECEEKPNAVSRKNLSNIYAQVEPSYVAGVCYISNQTPPVYVQMSSGSLLPFK